MTIVDVKVKILDNLQMQAMFPMRGYKDGDPLRCVYMLPAGFIVEKFPTLKDGLLAVADDMFRMFNQDDRPNGKYCKSFSIGDVVQLIYGDGVVSLACETIGWREVEIVGEYEFDNSMGYYLSSEVKVDG